MRKNWSMFDKDRNVVVWILSLMILSSVVTYFAGENRIDVLSKKVENMSSGSSRSAGINDVLTSAVQRVSPSVVSVTVFKKVPKMEETGSAGHDGLGNKIPLFESRGYKMEKVGAGSGFFVSADGYVATNKHVVYDKNAKYVVLLSDGSKKEAKIAYLDDKNDLAILKINGGGFHPVSLGNSDELKLGQSIFAVGNALGEYNNSVSVGIVSGLGRDIRAYSDDNTTAENLRGAIQIDAAINPGNSGGPLVDLAGNVVGINVATVEGTNNVSFALPINVVKGAIKSFLRDH